MSQYGDMPPFAPTLLLVGFSLVLGLYFGLFGLALALVFRATGSPRITLAAAPVFWVALELAAARITSVPWDQLGYSQVDNALVNQLAPFTGVYGISFLIVFVNALIAVGLLCLHCRHRRIASGVGVVLALAASAGLFLKPPASAPTALAVLIQPNLDVSGQSLWSAPGEWERHLSDFARLAAESCKPFISGTPQTGEPLVTPTCNVQQPDLIAWPESPAPFFEDDARFQKSIIGLAQVNKAPLVVGNIGMDFSPGIGAWRQFNSALVVSADGSRVGRYDKIHLVPFGEYVPFSRLLFFARKLTGKVSRFDRGDERKVFRLNGHRYGVFICYESVFADEVREFSELGAEVLVNISDDGWYGDTSAPWQHLNMARMRAIENRRWILRDTNNGVTASIDPYGRVRQSIPRHAADALPAAYGFNSDITFYSSHGDVFAWLCAILGFGIVSWAARKLLGQLVRAQDQSKVRS
jgi:apolipoprotein N-acyltransferase